jgi:hypothetical protein
VSETCTGTDTRTCVVRNMHGNRQKNVCCQKHARKPTQERVLSETCTGTDTRTCVDIICDRNMHGNRHKNVCWHNQWQKHAREPTQERVLTRVWQYNTYHVCQWNLYLAPLRGRSDRIVAGFPTNCNQCLSPPMLWVRTPLGQYNIMW